MNLQLLLLFLHSSSFSCSHKYAPSLWRWAADPLSPAQRNLPQEQGGKHWSSSSDEVVFNPLTDSSEYLQSACLFSALQLFPDHTIISHTTQVHVVCFPVIQYMMSVCLSVCLSLKRGENVSVMCSWSCGLSCPRGSCTFAYLSILEFIEAFAQRLILQKEKRRHE